MPLSPLAWMLPGERYRPKRQECWNQKLPSLAGETYTVLVVYSADSVTKGSVVLTIDIRSFAVSRQTRSAAGCPIAVQAHVRHDHGLRVEGVVR